MLGDVVKDLGPRFIALCGMTVDLISHSQPHVGSAQRLVDVQDDDGVDVDHPLNSPTRPEAVCRSLSQLSCA